MQFFGCNCSFLYIINLFCSDAFVNGMILFIVVELSKNLGVIACKVR